MKALFALIILATSFSSFAGLYRKPISCEGWGYIQGGIMKQKNKIRLEFNSVEDYREGSPWVGHRACIERKCYLHDPSLSKCEKTRDMIVCTGHGMGNGPELRVEIDLRTSQASGYYLNPWARRSASSEPDTYNTYYFEGLDCSGF